MLLEIGRLPGWIRVFHLRHWFESWNNTCFQEYYANQYNHVGVPEVWPIPEIIWIIIRTWSVW